MILVKLADRLHNMRTLEVLSGEKRRRIAKKPWKSTRPSPTAWACTPCAWSSRTLGFKAMHPMRAERIRQAVKKARGNRREIVGKIQESLVNCLAREGMEGQVIGREKHLYSIYQKMRGKRKAFNEIMDVYAFRIIVDKVDTCYRVLGAVHSLYKPFPDASRTTSRFPRPTATSRCIPPCSACTGCPSRSRSVPARWKRWPTTGSPRTGCTSPTTRRPRAPMPAPGNG